MTSCRKVFTPQNSFQHGLRSPQRSESDTVRASSVDVVVVVVVQCLGFCVLLIVAENKSRYIAPICMACFQYTWLLVTAEIQSEVTAREMEIHEALSIIERCSEKSLFLHYVQKLTSLIVDFTL